MKSLNTVFRPHLLAMILTTFTVTGVCLVAAVFILPAKSSAATFTGYFSQKSTCYFWSGSCQSVPQYQYNDVLTGRSVSNPTGTNAIPDPSSPIINNKIDFENWIIMRYNIASTNQEQTGISFVINTMMNAQASCVGKQNCVQKQRYLDSNHISEFRQRIEQSDVSMRYVKANPCNYSGNCTNSTAYTSFYDGRPTVNDDFYANYASNTRWLLVFSSNSTGKVFYVLEVPCGNPLGNLPGLPPPPSWNLNTWTKVDEYSSSGTHLQTGYTGSNSSAGIKVAPGETVTFTHVITNTGPDDMDQGYNADIFFTTSSLTFNGDANTARDCTNTWADNPPTIAKVPPCIYARLTNLSALANNASRTFPSSGTTNTNYSFVVPSGLPNGTQVCMKVAVNPQAWNDNTWEYSSRVCVQIMSPPPVGSKCGQIAALPFDKLQPNQIGTVTLTGLTSGTSYTVTYSDGAPSTIFTASGSTKNITFTRTAATAVILNLYVTSDMSTSCDNQGIGVWNMSTFNVYGAPVLAGGEFFSVSGGSCSGDGKLGGWYNNSSGNYGSGAQLSALAMIKITGFASAQYSGSPGTTYLTFANSGPADPTDVDSPYLGGNMGNYTNCLPEETPPPGAPTIPGSSFNLSTAASGSYVYTGAGSLVLTGTVGSGINIRIFSTQGDIYIPGDITYNPAGWGVGTVPSLLVQTDGSIYIGNGVKQLSGTYIARRSSSAGSGQIFTCATNASTLPSPGSIYATCNNQLTVYGSFVADQVNLMRTYGSLYDGRLGNSACSSAGGVSSDTIRSSCSGEVFEFSPEMYLSTPPPGGSSGIKYDSIKSLPPIL